MTPLLYRAADNPRCPTQCATRRRLKQGRARIAHRPWTGGAPGPHYVPDFLCRRDADALLSTLESDVCWQRERLRLYGREVEVPRGVAWCGEPGYGYRYSGRIHAAEGWLAALDPARRLIEAALGRTFSFALLNRYAHGAEYMGWHTDAEPEMTGVVASLSLGAERRFLFRPTGEERSSGLLLEHGSLLLFAPELKHSLPRCARAGLRINVTFRQLART